MPNFKDSAVPIHTLPDGREFITMKSVVECPEVRRFVERFSNYWTPAVDLCGWVGPLKSDD